MRYAGTRGTGAGADPRQEILELVLSGGPSVHCQDRLNNVEEPAGLLRPAAASAVRLADCSQLEQIQTRLLSEARPPPAMRPPVLSAVSSKQYVMQHYQEPITWKPCVRTSVSSVNYFSTLFKRETVGILLNTLPGQG